MNLRSFLTSLFLAPLAGFRRKKTWPIDGWFVKTMTIEKQRARITALGQSFNHLPNGWYRMRRNFIPPERL